MAYARDPSAVLIIVPLETWGSAPFDFKEALGAYSLCEPRRTRRSLCFTVCASRVEELARLSMVPGERINGKGA
jgi:hypothetical protein